MLRRFQDVDPASYVGRNPKPRIHLTPQTELPSPLYQIQQSTILECKAEYSVTRSRRRRNPIATTARNLPVRGTPLHIGGRTFRSETYCG